MLIRAVLHILFLRQMPVLLRVGLPQIWQLFASA